ncbi:hypothetical protein [Bdellovibrio sp. HCB337]|uniref:hypothetical protein n=1 Tax=Bdellovibrio sp. HCB337 TaxID=3394358 RepID=UPI0039A4A269
MEICLIYYSTASIQNLFQSLDYSPKKWLSNRLGENEKKILVARENHRRHLLQKNWQMPFVEILQPALQEFASSSVSMHQPPTLQSPEFFKRMLSKDLKTSLLELLPEYANHFKKHLERAQLSNENSIFYADVSPPGLIIHGNSTPTVGNLVFLAHEMGHVLFEELYPGDEVGSESFAFLLEDKVAQLLTTSEAEHISWIKFKKSQDDLNYLLCMNEFQEYATGVSKIPSHYLFFRESLLTCWGYQTINAIASLNRSKRLNQLCGSLDAVHDVFSQLQSGACHLQTLESNLEQRWAYR